MLKKILKSYDYSIIIAVFLLAIFGLVMIYSASMVAAIQRYGVPSDYFFVRQRTFLILGFILFLFFAFLPYKLYSRLWILVFLVFGSIISLLGLFQFGDARGNALSWYVFGSVSLQPSEFIKVAVIVYLAAVYAKKQPYINQFNKGVLPPLVFILLVCFLIVLQPDYGTASIILLIAASMIIASGMNFKTIVKLVSLGAALAIPGVILLQDKIFSEGRMQRFLVLTDPFREDFAQGASYQLINSFYAIASGGIHGQGLGKSIQKLGYLPEPHTDFIMAIIAEELGIFGVLFVLILLSYIVFRGLYIGMHYKDPFGSLLAIGIGSMIGIQTFINLAGISGIFPLMGIPLPFVSYGGSSLLQLSISMGILVNVSMFYNYDRKYRNKKVDVNENITY